MASRTGTRTAALAAAGLTVLLTGAVLLGVLGSDAQPPRFVDSRTSTSAPVSMSVPSATPGGPTASPSRTPSPSPSPTPKATPAYCRVVLRLPKTARVERSLRIDVSATAGCFAGPIRTVSTTLRRSTAGHRTVPVRWTSKGGPHDILIRKGVPTAGTWRLDLTSGTGLTSGVSGTLHAHR